MSEEKEKTPRIHFIRNIIKADLEAGKNKSKVVTRFPPEPNGFLHIGHAKSICLNFGMSIEFQGQCYLRFDDTNPEKESQEYMNAIQEDVKWLGFQWVELTKASDYFQKLYEYAIDLIKCGKAYIDSLTADEIREYRGTLTEPGKDSPYRNRSVEENLMLFKEMKAGKHEDGTLVLRAKLDMSSSNINMRDPVIYRVRHIEHHSTGDEWKIYPMYDFTHCISDALEGITHSLCTLEFEDHRPLYDWFLDQLDVPTHPQQIEFSRLNLQYTVISKRKLLSLVEEGHVDGWDDPRMPTIAGLRRRGFTPKSIRDFCEEIGISKENSIIDMLLLENAVRNNLNESTDRAFAIIDPLKLIITNYEEGKTEKVMAKNHPQKPERGERELTFERELFIERDDFLEDAPKKFFRFSIGREVRLKYGYYVTCTNVVKDANGKILEVHCEYDPESKGGTTADGRKVKGTIHWLSASDHRKAEFRLYDRLFKDANLAKADKFESSLNPDSLILKKECLVEPMLAKAEAGSRFQFERLGYFCADSKDHGSENAVYNRVVTLKDRWAKQS